MFSLIHLIFSLVKIAILASVYALIILFVFKIIAKQKPQSLIAKLSKKGFKVWFGVGGIISVLLFFWMLSSYGNHGFGDSARIPIGYGKSVNEIDGVTTYISPKNDENYSIDLYAIRNEYCVGQIHTNGNEYFIWNMEINELQELNSKVGYIEKSKGLNLPKQEEFKDFNTNYADYWLGWRFWLLP